MNSITNESQLNKNISQGIKNSFLKQENELLYQDDIRALIFAQIFAEKMEAIKQSQQFSGNFRAINQRTKSLKILCYVILGIFFVFHKPEWCLMRADIEQDCSIDFEGNEYYLSITYFINYQTDFMISLFIMMILLIYQYLKYSNVPEFQIEYVKLIIQSFCFFTALILRILIQFELIFPTNLENTMKILFILFSQNKVIRTLERFIKLVKFTLTIIGMFFLITLWFAMYFRVRLTGLKTSDQDDEKYYQVSFISYSRSFFTLINASFTENLPEFPLYLERTCFPSFIIFWLYIVITNIILLSLIMGIFFFIYNRIMRLNYIEICRDYPDFENKIGPILHQKFSSYEGIDSVIQHYRGIQIAQKTPIFRVKFMNAINKLRLIRRYHQYKIIKPHKYLQIRVQMIGIITDIMLSFYMILIPVMVQSIQNKRDISDYTFLSEILAILFLIDQYLVRKLENNYKVNFYDFIDFVSNNGIIICFHLIYLQRQNIYDHVYENEIFVVWQIFCILKIFRINKILMKLINYKIIIKTITTVYPLIRDLLTLLFVVIIFGSTILMTLFGGAVNSNYEEEFEKISSIGFALNELITFNDIISSMLRVTMMIFGGFNDLLLDVTVLGWELRKNDFDMLILRIFIISLYMLMIMFILNIVIGIILSLTGIYIENTKELAKIEDYIISENGIIDFILNEEDKITDEQKQRTINKKKQIHNQLRSYLSKLLQMSSQELEEEVSRQTFIKQLILNQKIIQKNFNTKKKKLKKQDMPKKLLIFEFQIQFLFHQIQVIYHLQSNKHRQILNSLLKNS